jgi:tetratricopeptide (TPR) repeat protein
MGKWQSRIAVPTGALALGVWLALGVTALTVVAPNAVADKKEEKPTLSPDVIKKLKPAQDALQKDDLDTGLALAKEALALSTKPYDQQQSLTMIRFAYGKKKDFPNYAAIQEQLNDNPLTTDDERNASWRTLAQIYAQQKDYDKAIKYATNWSAHGGGYEADSLLWQVYLVQKDCEHGIVPLERAAASHDPTEIELRQENSCYYQLKQDAKREAVMEQLVAKYPKRDYYYDLRLIYEDEKMDPRAMFNVLRLIYDKGYMTRESEFVKYADQAIDFGAPNEALAAMNKGKELDAVKFIAASDHNSQLLAQAKQQAAEDKKGIAAEDKSAAAGKNGEADVKVGLGYLGLGDYQKAVDAITRGLSADRVGRVRRVDEANMNLGIAYLKLGKTEEAKAAFTAAKADPRMTKAANLWLETL